MREKYEQSIKPLANSTKIISHFAVILFYRDEPIFALINGLHDLNQSGSRSHIENCWYQFKTIAHIMTKYNNCAPASVNCGFGFLFHLFCFLL